MSAGASAAAQSTPPVSDVFVARQPIFTRSKAVYGYELLYRSGRSQVYDGDHPGRATMSVIDNGLLVFGLEELTAGKKAFINFPRDLLVEDYASLLPHEKVVVEVLEDV